MLREHRFSMAALCAAVMVGSAPARAQEGPLPVARIRDNLFLLEEAYNQEPGVIQHIQLFQLDPKTRDWSYSFTDEWPVPDDLNQLSFTLPVVGLRGVEAVGVGDLMLNWRFQALGVGGKGIAALAPRVSVALPTGDAQEGTGRGSAGVQLNLPLSLEAGRYLVLHFNGGATITPDAKSPSGERSAAAVDANGGFAPVFQPLPWMNALVELSFLSAEEVGDTENQRTRELIVNPGLRFAVDVERWGLQIVPGVSVPLRVYPSDEFSASALLYLSFEHPAFEVGSSESTLGRGGERRPYEERIGGL